MQKIYYLMIESSKRQTPGRQTLDTTHTPKTLQTLVMSFVWYVVFVMPSLCLSGICYDKPYVKKQSIFEKTHKLNKISFVVYWEKRYENKVMEELILI